MKRRFLRPAAGYEELWNQVDHHDLPIPDEFNIGSACLDDQDPAAPALIEVDADGAATEHTFGDVKADADRLANWLRAQGVGRGDVVGLVRAASFETAVSFMAIFRLGAIAMPLSTLFGPDALRYRIVHSGARMVIVDGESAGRLREALAGSGKVQVVVVGGAARGEEHSYAEAVAGGSPVFEAELTRAEDPAFLIYTSGTTGAPKGALHAHRVIYGHVTAMEAIYDFYPRAGDVLWSPADWAWIAGLMDVLMPAWWFGLPVVVDRERRFSAERALWLMREFRVTLALLPPTALRAIRAAGADGGGFSLRVVASGAEVLGAELLDWCRGFFGCELNEGYGQTELNVSIGNCASVYPVRPGSLGRALPGTVVAVVDETGRPVTGVEGEIAVGRHHPNTFLGYWRNEDATRAKFAGDWLLTGDLGVMDEEGYVWFVSRKDDVIKSSGYRIGPGEIEEALCSHESVAMSGVTGVPDERRGEVPKAFVVLRDGVDGSDALADELRDHVRRRLASHEVPREIVFLAELPRTTTGKLLRRALREL